MIRKIKLSTLWLCCFLLTGCVGTMVGVVVDTAIEIVKVPFKVGGAVIDVVSGDDESDLTESTQHKRPSSDAKVDNTQLEKQIL